MRDKWGGRREEREHSTIKGQVAKLIVILMGSIILQIGPNEMVTVVITIIKVVGVDQSHVAGGGLQPWIQTL